MSLPDPSPNPERQAQFCHNGTWFVIGKPERRGHYLSYICPVCKNRAALVPYRYGQAMTNLCTCGTVTFVSDPEDLEEWQKPLFAASLEAVVAADLIPTAEEEDFQAGGSL